MKTPRKASPARSQGSVRTPIRHKPRRALSIPSARSSATVIISALTQQRKENASFVVSPLGSRKSILSDNTEIEEPRRKSWWKNLRENSTTSRDVVELLEENENQEPNNFIEELDMEILSQENKKNYTLEPLESSDSESINSIVITQRKLFPQRKNQEQQHFAQIVGSRESLAKLNETVVDKTIVTGTRELFQKKQRTRPIFPAALLNISPNKTVAEKTPNAQARNIFGQRNTKRKNIFTNFNNFIVTESEDEIPDIQPKVFNFRKTIEASRRSSLRGIREPSPASSITTDMEMDDWKMLPSSTMVENLVEDLMPGLTPKRARLSNLAERESEAGSNASNKQSNEYNSSKEDKSRKSKTFTKEKAHEIDLKEIVEDQGQVQNESNIQDESREVEEDNDAEQERESEAGNNASNKQSNKSNSSKEDKSRKSKTFTKEKAHKIDLEEIVEDQGQVQNESNIKDESREVEEDNDPEQERESEAGSNASNKQSSKSNSSKEDKSRKSKTFTKEKGHKIDLEEIVEDQGQVQNESNIQDESRAVEEDNDAEQERESEAGSNASNKQSNKSNSSKEDTSRKSKTFTKGKAHKIDLEEIVEDQGQVQNESNIQDESREVEEDNDAEQEEQVAEQNESDVQDEEQNVEYSQEESAVDEKIETPNVSHSPNKSHDKGVDSENQEESAVDEKIETLNVSHSPDNSHDKGVDSENQEESAVDEIVEAPNVSHSPDNSYDKGVDSENREKSAVDEKIETLNVSHSPDNSHDKGVDSENQEESAVDEIIEAPNVSHSPDNSYDEGVDSENQEESAVDEIIETYNVSHSPDNSHDKGVDSDNQEESAVDEIIETPNVSHDTTGRNRKKIKSPEAVLRDSRNLIDSFYSVKGDKTVRKTEMPKSTHRDLVPARESLGFSDGSDSNAQGSGWDSHRTTRKTLRQTYGRDFTPRKSLRALVMEKSAKRQTQHNDMASVTGPLLPQANSTEMPSTRFDDEDDDENENISPNDISLRTRQTTIEKYLMGVAKMNADRRKQSEEKVLNSLKEPPTRNIFKIPATPLFARNVATKPKESKSAMRAAKVTKLFGELPQEVLEDLMYKPPKRFQPRDAPWATKHLYKFLEAKLDPKYNYKSRVRAERLVEHLYNFTKDLRRRSVASPDAVEVLKREMARLHIVKTHHEFYEFFGQFMPRDVRRKVMPDLINNIDLPKQGVFSDIF